MNKFYARERNARLAGIGTNIAINNYHMRATCPYCGHSKAAHAGGTKCALCNCVSRPRELVQESLAFRSSIPLRVTANTRKR